MKHIRLFDDQASAIGKEYETPIVAGLRTVAGRVAYGPTSLGETALCSADGDFITFQPVSSSQPTLFILTQDDDAIMYSHKFESKDDTQYLTVTLADLGLSETPSFSPSIFVVLEDGEKLNAKVTLNYAGDVVFNFDSSASGKIKDCDSDFISTYPALSDYVGSKILEGEVEW